MTADATVPPLANVPPLVTLHVWRVAGSAVPRALARMAVDPRRVRALPGVGFAKLLGTAAGFGLTHADPTRYAALIAWADPAAAARFDDTATGRAWGRIARTHARIDLRPLGSRGSWAGRRPFGEPRARDEGAEVLALTRARLRPQRALTFWRAIRPVAHAADGSAGLLARFGIGEAPVGWQGTVSVWRSATDLAEFAYRHPEHRAAIVRTPEERWYAEELFARFAVLAITGDRSVLGWMTDGARRDGRGGQG